MQEIVQMPPPQKKDSDEDDIDLWAIAGVIWRRRLVVAAITCAGTLGSAIIAFSQPNIYTATATIMPVDSSNDRLSTALSSLGALGGLASQAGVGLKGGVSDKFVALLKSRTLAETVITKYDLLPELFPERWDSKHAQWKESTTALSPRSRSSQANAPSMHDAVRQVKRILSTKGDLKTGLIDVVVEHQDPVTAANIANHFVAELNSYLKQNSLTSAKQNRVFLEGQLQHAASELSVIENNLKHFQEKNKLVSLDAQTQASVQAYVTLKSQLMAKEMEISLQENSTSENDIQLLGLRQEVSQLKEKLLSLENGTSGGLVSFKDAPQLGMRFAQLTRDLLVRQKVFELLTQQYELAKIEEAKETLTFQVIDQAIPSDKKSKPNRVSDIIMASIVSLILGGSLAVLLNNIDRRFNQQKNS
jgi:uncharacterized protein involved in exopolysaccharide biosynthesis